MKLLLVSPAQLQDNGQPLKVKKVFYIPLSLYLIAGHTPGDWKVKIVNDYSEDIPYEGDYDLVGITMNTLHSKRGYEIAGRFRERGRPVVLGGFHPTLFPEEAGLYADAIVCGEADLVWKEVLADAAAGRLKPRYQAERLSDMKNTPMPRYDLIKKRNQRNLILPVEFSRGCPYNCEYCSVTQFYGHKYRTRSMDEVVRDIKATGSRLIDFVDDNIAGNMTAAAQLFESLVPLKIYWIAQVPLHLASDEKLLALAARSGFRFAIIGIETLDSRNLKTINKGINQVEEYIERIRLFQKYGITVCVTLMFGFDNDTPETFKKTYQFIEKLGVVPSPFIVTPFPGTSLYHRMKTEGRLLHHDYWRYTSFQTVFRPANFTPNELDGLFMDFYKRCYAPPLIMKRFFSMLSPRQPVKSLLTQLMVTANSLVVHNNLRRGILPVQ